MCSRRAGLAIGARIGRRLPPTAAVALANLRPILTQSADYASADCVGLRTVGVVGTALKKLVKNIPRTGNT